MKCDKCGAVINVNKKPIITIDGPDKDKTIFCQTCSAELLILTEYAMDVMDRTHKALFEREIIR